VILQIVPRAPGGRDGVGDYARTLAVCLERINGCKTTFVSAAPSAALKTGGLEVLSPLSGISAEQWRHHPWMAIVLHYVNYGYHRRGVPCWLPGKLRHLQRLCPGRLITIFHELYASGSWWQSAFWLRSTQMRITRAIARLSDLSIVSSDVLCEQLHCLAPNALILVRPVFSNFGEPVLAPEQIVSRDPHRWVICGGTELIERSLRSLLNRRQSVSEPFAPRELFVVGGADRSAICKTLTDNSDIAAHYLPNVDVAIASGILMSCAFGWIDYFERADVPTAAILKSTTFAAYCAHGVIPIFPCEGSRIALHGDALPGPFFVTEADHYLPKDVERPAIAVRTYEWYRRNASSEQLAGGVASALGFAPVAL